MDSSDYVGSVLCLSGSFYEMRIAPRRLKELPGVFIFQWTSRYSTPPPGITD